jgi:hypothetical protein
MIYFEEAPSRRKKNGIINTKKEQELKMYVSEIIKFFQKTAIDSV